jgi:hypothetical protein
MNKAVAALAACVAVAACVASRWAIGQSDSNGDLARKPAQELASGWSLIKDGEAEGSIESDARRPSDSDTKFLHITVTKTAKPGQGRVGAINGTTASVDEGKWYDVTLEAIADGRSVGIVFSLEGADGKVLARTTLPEIGRVRRGGGGTDTQSNPTPRKYTVALHARGTSDNAHVTLTPIEPTSVWIENLTLAERTNTP